eukprot:jgi/Chrzof1/10195/Cz04g32090.t1
MLFTAANHSRAAVSCHQRLQVRHIFLPHPPAFRKQRGAALLVHARKTSSSSSVSDGLVTVLKDEFKIEKERYRQPPEVMEGPPGPFQLDDQPNSSVVTLARTFSNGDSEEEIFVEVDLDEQRYNEDDDEEEDEVDDDFAALTPVKFTVNIAKSETLLVFECESNGQFVQINHVALDDTSGDDDNVRPYTGPVFDDLDDTLQQAFQDYLEERGITTDFALYLIMLVQDKLEVEYINWLQRVQKFVVT